MTNIRIAALCAASVLAAAAAAPATAQSYYARERISTPSGVTTPAPTPSPTPAPAPAVWVAGAWSAWSTHCSSSATATRNVVCQRAGATVADSNCTEARPASTDVQPVFTGCTFTATYGQYSACSAGSQSAPIVSCTRSDNTPAALSSCANQTDVRSCTMPATSCGELKSGRWSSGTGSVVRPFTASATTAAAKVAEAAAGCASIGIAGSCRFNIESDSWSFVPNGNVSSGWGGHLYASVCTL